MSGGVWEYTMGNMIQEGTSLGIFHANSNSGTWEEVPELKYYDSYEYDTDYLTHSRGYLGDGTKETLKSFGTDFGGWYGDYSRFPHTTNVWFRRGGFSSNGSSVGAFAFNRSTGSPYYSYGFRVVLILE